MLILSRKTNQRLVIGDSIEITVVELHDGHVRLGISAPRDVPVYRKELLDEIAAENAQAAASAQTSDLMAPDIMSKAVGGVVPAKDSRQPVVAVLSTSGPTTKQSKGG